jgi:hypothetical protein
VETLLRFRREGYRPDRDLILALTRRARGWACRWERREMAELLIAHRVPVHEPAAEPCHTARLGDEMGDRDKVGLLNRQSKSDS